jgi:hypothetical protein
VVLCAEAEVPAVQIAASIAAKKMNKSDFIQREGIGLSKQNCSVLRPFSACGLYVVLLRWMQEMRCALVASKPNFRGRRSPR